MKHGFSFLALLYLVAACDRVVFVPGSNRVTNPTAPGIIGHEGGNGGDTIVGLNTGAWFLKGDHEGDRPIATCLKLAPNFGVNEAAARALVEETVETWRFYLELQDISLLVGKVPYRPAGRVKWGDCGDDTDLTIYLGVTPEAVEGDRKKFVNPLAFAWPTEPAGDDGWRRGYIWVAPPGSHGEGFPRWGTGKVSGADSIAQQASLRQILMHEWGHILGCDHVAGTIMRVDILPYLRADANGENFAKRYNEHVVWSNLSLGLVDGELQLMLSRICYGTEEDRECRNDLETRLLSHKSDGWLEPEALSLLFGDNKVQLIHITLELRTKVNGSQHFVAFYRGSPTSGRVAHERRFSIDLPDAPLAAATGPRVFKMVRGSASTEFRAAGDEVLSGVIEIGGTTYPVLIQRSPATEGQSQIWILKDGKRLRLN